MFPPPVCASTGSYHPCSGALTFGPNPYMYEIHDDDTPEWLCEYHAQESADDI